MSAVDTAFHGLRAMIADGALQAGDRLPSENELCERLGVSRSSLREAIRTLSALGVVETRHGSGTYVGSLRASDLIASLSLTVGLLPLESMLELYELRRIVEADAASRAAARATEGAVAELSDLLDQLENAYGDEDQGELDFRFHSRVAELAESPALAALAGVLRSRSRAYRIFLTEDAAQIKHASDLGHRAILEGLARRDPAMASAAAAAHVVQTEFWLRKHRPAVAASSDGEH